MRNALAIARRILSQFAHDRRTLALLFVAPIVMLWLLTVLLGQGDYEPRYAAVDLPASYHAKLLEEDCTVSDASLEEATAMLGANEVDAILYMGGEDGDELTVWVEGSDATKSAASMQAAGNALAELRKDAADKMQADVDAKKAEIEDLKKDAEKTREKIQRQVDKAKRKAEEKKAEVSRKRAEAKSKIASVHRKVSSVKSNLKKLSKQLEKLASKQAALKKTLAKMPADAKKQMGLEGIEKTLAADTVDLSAIKKLGSSSFDFGSIDESFDFDADMDLDLDVDMDSIEIPDMDDFSFELADYLPVSDVDTVYLHGTEDWKMFDFYGPVFIGIFLFAFVFLTSGMSLVNERSAGTMSRFLATPVRPAQILGGYTLGFGALALVQAAVILTTSLHFIGFPNEGNVFLVVFLALSLALVSVTLGLLVSGLASSAFQVIQLMLLFVVPQILLSGLFDLSAAPGWLQGISACLPLTYGVDALRAVMLRGAGLQAIWPDIAVIWGFIAAFFLLACAGFRKKRARRFSHSTRS